VAVGKSTNRARLQALLARWERARKVDLVTTDGFLYPNAILEKRRLMGRKGFMRATIVRHSLLFVGTKGRTPSGARPVYSHLTYDIIPNEGIEIDRPDI